MQEEMNLTSSQMANQEFVLSEVPGSMWNVRVVEGQGCRKKEKERLCVLSQMCSTSASTTV